MKGWVRQSSGKDGTFGIIQAKSGKKKNQTLPLQKKQISPMSFNARVAKKKTHHTKSSIPVLSKKSNN